MHMIDGAGAAVARRWRRRLAPLLACVLLLAPSGCILFGATAAVGAAGGAAVASSADPHRAPGTLHTSAGSFPRGASVSIALDAARDVLTVGPRAGDTTLVRGAHTLIGRLTAVRGDTLLVALGSATLAGGERATYPRGGPPTIAVVPPPVGAVRVIAERPGATEWGTFAALAGSALAVALLVAALRDIGSGT
jgi:hypothetical protein